MNDNKFTIKFKGVLDHASTKKSLEKDISILEKVLKPKRTKLDSTEKILKHNLKEKKTELAKQNKYEKLRESVEKFRLQETKKLIKQGMKFEEARKYAFKKSLMSSKDLRKLEYESLSKQKNLLSKSSKNILQIATGTAIGQLAAGGIKGAFSGTLGFAKQALEADAIKKRHQAFNLKVFDKNEYNDLSKKISDMRGFERETDKELFLRSAAVLKGDLNELGINTKENLNAAVMLAASLKSSGISDNDAISEVSTLLKGEGGSIFKAMSVFKGFGHKYSEQKQMEYERVTSLNNEFDSRIHLIKEIHKDLLSTGLTKATSFKEDTSSKVTKITENLNTLTVNALKPLLGILTKLTNWLVEFSFQKSIIEPLKSVFNFSKLTSSIVQGFKDWWSGTDSTKTETDSSVETPH
ncbi:DUF759 family protein [Borrelia crocidurae]|uniref:Uncharacterized protein n=1 Tax=Borrelia crocidurae (strain Achema) TaxID=1155096 RepID=I0FDW3_BORCA|nr:DUF759 family protein [Borrelia crocidurae]AFI31669.1 hypothetical protein Q7M_1526 [Borrelia crocidurae str. Achema]